MGYEVNVQKMQAQGITSNGSLVLPAGAQIIAMNIANTTANSILGGLNLGTTSNGSDVLLALTVGANAFVPAIALKTVFSTSSTQTIYYSAVTGWNSANVNINIWYVI